MKSHVVILVAFLFFASFFIVNVSASSDCRTLTADYILANNVNSSGTCFTIGANNITLDCQGYTINYTTGSSAGYAINNTDGYDNITIKSCNIVLGNTGISNSYAIYGSGMANSTIYNNNINTTTTGSNSYGIRLTASSNYNNITGNNLTTAGSNAHVIYITSSSIYNNITYNNIIATGNTGYGIYLASSSTSNSIANNNIATTGSSGNGMYIAANSNNITSNNVTTSSTGYGIDIQSSTTNILTNNRVNTSQSVSIVVYGTTASQYNQTIDTSNLAEGLPVLYYFSSNNTVIQNQDYSNTYGQIIFARSTNVTISNVTMSNDGFSFFNVSNSAINNSNITTSTGWGIFLYGNSINNILSNNNITTSGNGGYGFFLYSNNLNNVTNNIVTTSGTNGYGITLNAVNLTNIINNNVTTTGNTGYGILLQSSNSNNITSNNVTTSGSSGYGVYFSTLNSNNLSNNTITTVSYGVVLASTNSSTIANNNITVTGSSVYGFGLGAGSLSTSNNITNNNILATGTGSFGFSINLGQSNNITSGSVISQKGYYDYYLNLASTTNNFTNTNFTTLRRIYFADVNSWFNYQNDSSSGIWLKTNVSATSNINRTLVSWNNTLMKWNDTNSTPNITSNYNLTGLQANQQYEIYNTSAGVQTSTYTLTTDSNGALNFTIKLNGNTEILVNTPLPPQYFANTTGIVTLYNGSASQFNITWNNVVDWMSMAFIQLNFSNSPVNYTMDQISQNSTHTAYGYAVGLGVGNYSYQYFANTSANLWNNTPEATTYVSKGILSGTIAGSNVNSPNSVNVIATESNSVGADVNYTFWRDGILFSSANNSNPSQDASHLARGTYNYILNSSGGANWTANSSIATLAITVDPAIQNQTYGGSISISGNAVSKTFPSIAQDASQTINEVQLGPTNTGLSELIITVNTKVVSPKLTIEGSEQRSEVVPDAGVKVYRYINITTENLQEHDLAAVTIRFKVDKSWLNDNNISSDNVGIYRLSNELWTELNISKTGEDSSKVYYSAISPGLSIFAITGGKIYNVLKPLPTSMTTTVSTTTSTVAASRKISINYAAVLVTVVVIQTVVIAWAYRRTINKIAKRKKQKKSKLPFLCKFWQIGESKQENLRQHPRHRRS